MRTVLCILTLNERTCLEVIFPQIKPPGAEAGYDEIVAIDAASTDGTPEYFQEKHVPVLRQSGRGRGDAFLLAFSKIDADAYIFFSPDGNEAVEDLGRFRPLFEQGADLVIASRMMQGAANEEDIHLFKWRKWANKGFNLIANLLFRRTGPFITDSINGYRAITRGAAKCLELDARDYTIEYQMTIRAMKRGLRVVEFPTVEGQRISGRSGAPSLPTGLNFLRCLARELMVTK